MLEPIMHWIHKNILTGEKLGVENDLDWEMDQKYVYPDIIPAENKSIRVKNSKVCLPKEKANHFHVRDDRRYRTKNIGKDALEKGFVGWILFSDKTKE